MAFTKGMKKGLSVLLSLAMVVTSVSINGKTADAAAGDVTVEATSTAEKLADNKVTVTGAVAEAENLDAGELSVSVVKLKTQDNSIVEDGVAEGIETGTVEIGTEDATTFSVDLTVADTVAVGDYRVKVAYKKTGEESSTNGSADFKVNPQYSIVITNAAEKVTADAKDVTFNGTVKAWDGTKLEGDDIVTLSTTAKEVTLPEKVTVEDGEFTFKAELDGLKEVTTSVITAKVAGTNGAEYSADATVVVTPKAGVVAYLRHVGSGWWPQYNNEWYDATSETQVAVDATKADEYTLKLESDNWGMMAFVQFYDVNDKERDLSDYVKEIVIKSVKVDGEEVEAGPESNIEKYISYDSTNGLRINLYNCYWDVDSNYFETEKSGNTVLKDSSMASKPLEITFEVKKDFAVSEGEGGEGTVTTPGAVATAAAVTGITMAPNAITATAGAVTTKAAVLTVSGSALDLLTVNNVTVSAVSTSGITVALPTKAAVTATAAAVTFEAVVTVPATCATGDYVLVASAGAVTASVATVSVIAAAEVTPDDVHTTKLVVKTASGTNKVTMGVGETAKIKVNKKPANSVDAVTAESAKAKVVKASINKAGKLVLKAKKVGKAKVTLTSGTVTKKVTVTVMKAPKKLTLKDGKKAAKKTVKLNAKTKKNVTKKYKVVLPKKTASYGYTIKKSGKKAIIKKAVVNTNKKGVQTLVITVKKKAKGSAKVVVTSAANKKAKATVKVKASK